MPSPKLCRSGRCCFSRECEVPEFCDFNRVRNARGLQTAMDERTMRVRLDFYSRVVVRQRCDCWTNSALEVCLAQGRFFVHYTLLVERPGGSYFSDGEACRHWGPTELHLSHGYGRTRRLAVEADVQNLVLEGLRSRG